MFFLSEKKKHMGGSREVYHQIRWKYNIVLGWMDGIEGLQAKYTRELAWTLLPDLIWEEMVIGIKSSDNHIIG